MMRMYKRAVKEQEGTTNIDKEVLGCWEMLVKKGGDTDRYRVIFIKEGCSGSVKDTITDFGIEHGVSVQALMGYVIGFWPYYPSEDDQDEEDESDDEDGDSSEDEDGDSDLSDE